MTVSTAKSHSRIDRLRIWLVALRASLSMSYGSKELAIFEASLRGVLPDPLKTPAVILAACDDHYFATFGVAFLKSINRAPARHGVHLHLLEPSTETIEMVESLAASCSNVELTYTVDPCSAVVGLRFRNLYYNASRFVLAPAILKCGVERLLIVDVDCIMNRSPWPSLNTLPHVCDAAFILRPEKRKPWNKILAAAVLYTNRSTSWSFASKFARSILMALNGQPKYHVDQILPHYLMKLAHPDILEIPSDIMSYDRSPSAAFWTAKGAGKRDKDFLTLVESAAQ